VQVVVLRSGVSEGNGHELRRVVGLHPHEHGTLAVLLRFAHGFADILWGSDLGPADLMRAELTQTKAEIEVLRALNTWPNDHATMYWLDARALSELQYRSDRQVRAAASANTPPSLAIQGSFSMCDW
jgi:hypothetical protein